MYCQSCGKELPVGASACPACGARVYLPPPSSTPSPNDPVEKAVADMKRAAKDLAATAAQVSRRMADEAEKAAKDPSGSAKRAAKKVAHELDNVAKEVDKILHDL